MLCTDNDWRINDSSGSFKMIVEIHDIEDGSGEIGETYSQEYCDCGKNPNILSYIELEYTESQVISSWFSNDNTKTINDVVNDMKNLEGVGDAEAKLLIKEQFEYVKEWSI